VFSIVLIFIVFVNIRAKLVLTGVRRTVIVWVEFVIVFLDIMAATVARWDVHLAHIGILQLQRVLITVQQNTIKIFTLALVSLVIVVVINVTASQRSVQIVLQQP